MPTLTFSQRAGCHASRMLCIAILAAGCAPGDAPVRGERAGTLSSDDSSTRKLDTTDRWRHLSISGRFEAQRWLDSAARAFRASDYRGAGEQLRIAAAFVYGRAAAAKGEPHEELVAAAQAIDYAATSVVSWNPERSKAEGLATIKRVSAATNRAEARFHADAASVALSRSDAGALAAALLMTADHAERAVRDERQPLGEASITVLDDARALAAALQRAHAIIPDNARATVDALARVVRELPGAPR